MADRKKQKPDPEATRPANNTVGETLRAMREARGLELEAVSQVIHIRSTQLKAIEENNLEGLPGMTYAVGFVRSYANFLGLNGAEIVHRFKAEHGHNPAQSKLSFPQPITESRVPDPMMVGVGAFLAVVILVLWTVYSNMHSDSKTAEKLPPAPVVTSVADGLPSATPAASATTTPATATTAPATEQSAATMPTPSLATMPSAPEATATQSTAPAIAVPGQSPAVAATTIPAAPVTEPPKTEPVTAAPAKKETAADDEESEDDNADDAPKAKKASRNNDDDENDDDGVINIKKGKSRITLKAKEASWVQVVDAHQKILYRKVLRPGEQYSVPDQPGLLLDTANAGGLNIVVDGKKVQPIGKDGDILRGIALDPQELKNTRARRD